MDNNYMIINVPEVAEFNKYWLVEEIDDNTFKYCESYFTEDEALEAFSDKPQLKIIKNKSWGEGRKLLDTYDTK